LRHGAQGPVGDLCNIPLDQADGAHLDALFNDAPEWRLLWPRGRFHFELPESTPASVEGAKGRCEELESADDIRHAWIGEVGARLLGER
jgi:hypothetical protein